MSNFGIGLSAFADGFNRGWGMGDNIAKSHQRNKANRVRRDAIDAAKVDYDKSIADNVLTQAGQASTDQPFDAEGAAKESRKQNTFTDFLYQQKMPEIIDSMVQSGDIEGAETMRKWSEDAKERKFMDSFGKTLGNWAVGQSSGDYEPFAKSAVDLLNKGNYGMTATGYELIKDSDGNTTGLAFDLKQGDKEIKHTFNSIDEAAQFLSAQGSPANRAKQWYAQQDEAQKIRANTTQKRIEAAIGLGKDTALENVKQGNRMELEDRRTENKLWENSAAAVSGDPKLLAKASTARQILREANHSDEQINKWMPSILGVREEARQSMSGDDLVKFAMETLGRTDDVYIEADGETKQKMIQDFIAAFRATAKSASPSYQAPGIGAPKQDASVPRY